jgi:hypothetical protein
VLDPLELEADVLELAPPVELVDVPDPEPVAPVELPDVPELAPLELVAPVELLDVELVALDVEAVPPDPPEPEAEAMEPVVPDEAPPVPAVEPMVPPCERPWPQATASRTREPTTTPRPAALRICMCNPRAEAGSWSPIQASRARAGRATVRAT